MENRISHENGKIFETELSKTENDQNTFVVTNFLVLGKDIFENSEMSCVEKNENLSIEKDTNSFVKSLTDFKEKISLSDSQCNSTYNYQNRKNSSLDHTYIKINSKSTDTESFNIQKISSNNFIKKENEIINDYMLSAMEFLPDMKLIVLGDLNGKIVFFDSNNYLISFLLKGHNTQITKLKYLRKHELISLSTNMLKIWDLVQKKCIQIIQSFAFITVETINNLNYSFITSEKNGEIKL